MGINLHEEKEVDRDVEDLEVTQMRGKMAQHSEETNELFNLMARSIKKRCEERVNLYMVEETVQKQKDLPVVMDEAEMDDFMLSNEHHEDSRVVSSRGNSPPKDWGDADEIGDAENGE